MNSLKIATDIVRGLHNLEELFSDLVSRSELAGDRQRYHQLKENITNIKTEMEKECQVISDKEGFTFSLDKF
ncbi:MAG: hypothetical protein ACOX0E_00430 [Syntrophomonadaceae bacterium]|jgi:ABC-type phosphate transport system auxiliary subunit